MRFSQEKSDESPVDLGVTFAFDANGDMSTRCHVNLEANLPGPQKVNFIEVSGAKTWHGSPHNLSSYAARLPMLGPFVEVLVNNRAAFARRVSVWGYLVA